MVISFVCLVPVHPFLFSMAVLYHVNRELEQQRQRRLRKRHLKSEVALLQTLSRLFHLVQFVKCWKFFLELNSKKLYQSSESCGLVFTSSTKREIMHFHVLDVQWRQRNLGKSVMHVQGCCFVNLNLGLLLFCRFRWRHRRRCLSFVITSYRRLISRSRIWFKMTSHFLNVLLQKLISSHYYIISNGHSLYLWQPNPTYSVSVLLFAPSGVFKAMVAHSLESWRIHVKVLCILSKDSEY